MNVDDSTDNRAESAPQPIENEIIESWTFLGEATTNTIHQGDSADNIIEHHDSEETKLSTKTSRSSSSYLS